MPIYPYNTDIGQTDLMGAAYNGDADEVTRILGMPCDIDAQDAHGMSALMYAAMQGHAAVVQRLVEQQALLELQSPQRFTALMYAVRNGHAETVRVLLQSKADPDVHGDYDIFETPLTLAAGHGYFPIVRLLVAAGADVGLHGGYGQRTAECVARHAEYHEISEFLCYHVKRPASSDPNKSQ